MKKISILLLILFTVSTSFCYGQVLVSEKGLILEYQGYEKIGSRKDEYCKTTFDIYEVKGKVTNKNTDKAANVTAILHFNGSTCNKVYSNEGPISGEIKGKRFGLNIIQQSKQKSEYWVNQLVHLLPESEKTAYGYVEVKQGEPFPEPDHSFSYELIPRQESIAPNKPKETIEVKTAASSADKSKKDTYTNIIRDIKQKVDVKPRFPGGIEGWSKFLQENLNADIPSSNGAPVGTYTANVEFIVSRDGSISNLNCTNDPGYGTCAEALRILKLSPNWIPAKLNGQNVVTRFKQPITFKITGE